MRVPRLTLAACLAALGVLAFMSAPAFAAAPEAPEVTVEAPVPAREAVLHGVLNPNAVGEAGNYEFLYKAGGACEGGAHAPESPGLSLGAQHEEPTETLTGLLPNTEYTVCLRAESELTQQATTSPPAKFTTASVKPVVSDEVAKNLTATTADLTSRVNPEGTDTTYRFQYGTTTAYGTATTPADAGAGFAEVPVTGHLKELQAGQTYHWRLVAESTGGETMSVDHTFVYETAAEPLPDGRRYEMVTPVDKNGAVFGSLALADYIHVARDGEAVTSPVVQCFAGAESCSAIRQNTGSPYEFHRTSAGWVSRPLALPSSSGEGQTPWLSGFSAIGGEERATALFSTQLPESVADGFIAHEPDGTVQPVGPIAENAEGNTFNRVANQPFDATADMSHIVYQSKVPIWSFDQSNAGAPSLYEYVGRHQASPVLVAVTGGLGSQELITGCGAELAEPFGALSGDGRTIYFNTVGCVEPSQVYARIDEARTVQISEHAASGCGTTCMAAPPSSAFFRGASSDGEVSFFTSGRQLTDDAAEDPETNGETCNVTTTGCNLYESRCPDHCEHPAERTLVDVSAGDTSGLGPQVQGTVAIPPNGSGVYFVGKGVLTEEHNTAGDSAQPGALNLYDYRSSAGGAEGHTQFVGTLSAADSQQFKLGKPLDNVTPDGRFLVFTSHRALTRDDTRPVGPAQVYRYDSLTRTLVRISVGRDGFNDDGNTAVADASIVFPRDGGKVGSPRTNPTVSDDGQYVFFETPTGLTPGALDSAVVSTSQHEGGGVPDYAQNIYEYHEGQVSLISDGRDLTAKPELALRGAVELLGTSASGADVLFETASPLVPQDTDTQRDFYDAHICSESSPCPPSAAAPAPPCHGEECHGPAAVSVSPPAAASESFSGPGNLTSPVAPPPVKKTAAQLRARRLTAALRACHKLHARSRRKACERTARKRYGPAHAAR